MAHYEELDALDLRSTLNVGPRIESPTPHKIAVLLLVQQYINVKKAAADAGLLHPAPSRRNFCLLLLDLIQYPDMSYSDLHNLLTSTRFKIDAIHLEGFEKAMSDMFALGIEPLLDFSQLQNIEGMLAEELGVSQFSIVGLYIRRVGVVLERLTFSEMMKLYRNICLYYEKGVRALAFGTCKSASKSIKTPVAAACSKNIKNLLVDDDALEKTSGESLLIADISRADRNTHGKWSLKQSELFVTQQNNLLSNNELQALSPKELQTKLTEIIHDNPLYSQAYFLSYLNQLRVRDYFGAMDALHRAFDRCPMQITKNCDKKGFQYFSLNLSSLHSTFNHQQESLNTLKESIMLAQESGDKTCLDMASCWYGLLNNDNNNPFDKNLPDTQDTDSVLSISLAIQDMVKYGALSGYKPLQLFELLKKCDELNVKNAVTETVTESLALHSALWCLYGRNEMSAMYAQLLLNLKKTAAWSEVGNSESVSKVLSSLALWLNIQGEQQLSMVVLNHARERFPREPDAIDWMTSDCLITIQNAIYRFHWEEAFKACCQLYLHNKHEANLQRASVFVAKCCYNEARRIIDKLLANNDLDTTINVRALLLQAYTTMAENRMSSQTVDLLMRASVFASSKYLVYEQAMVDVVLADVLLRMDMPQKAYQAIKNSMERIHASGGLYHRAKTDFIFVRCLVATGDNAKQKKQYLQSCVNILERAAESFKKLEAHAKVLDVFVYLSKSFDALEDYEQRNKYACKFKQHYTEFPIPREYMGLAY